MRVLIGISGGIAAYKIPSLVRYFVKNGDELRVIITKDAESFVSVGTLGALTGHKVYKDFNPESGSIEHIELASWADIFIIAPATANTIAKLAKGEASSVLLATALAYKGFLAVFPSMNVDMLEHPATKTNIEQLRSYNYKIYDVDEGSLACGVIAKGRLPEMDFIFNAVSSDYKRANTRSRLKGTNFLLSMGYTKAYIDPVRFVSNGSSGQMGFELAKALYEQGANLSVIVNKEILTKYTILDYYADEITLVETTKDTAIIAKKLFKEVGFYISAMAFSDFDSLSNKDKLKIHSSKFTLEFNRAEDVLKMLSASKQNQITVGFALESKNIEVYAREKLENKNLDMIIANDVNAIGSNDASIVIMHREGRIVRYSKMPKHELAGIILAEIERVYLREES